MKNLDKVPVQVAQNMLHNAGIGGYVTDGKWLSTHYVLSPQRLSRHSCPIVGGEVLLKDVLDIVFKTGQSLGEVEGKRNLQNELKNLLNTL